MCGPNNLFSNAIAGIMSPARSAADGSGALCQNDPRVGICAGENGKPRLVQRFTDIRFNLSHTDGLALIAITRGREVGVSRARRRDIEFENCRDVFRSARVWDSCVTPANERVSRFFNVWTQRNS